jgi:translation initiation factor 3 subunit E
MATKYDLTPTITPYLDRHMVWPLLEFLDEKKLYPAADISKNKLKILSRTKMLDALEDEYKKLYKSDPPPVIQAHRINVMKEIKTIKNECAELLKFIEDTEPVKGKHPEVKESQLNSLYHYAKLMFDCGQYENCARDLEFFRQYTTDPEKQFWALWGILASNILMNHHEQAWKDLTDLRTLIDQRDKEDQVTQLQQRTWLVHWSLFIMFNLKEESDRMAISDFLFQDKLLNAIQLNCPHVLRYLTVSMILRRTTTKDNDFKDLLRILQLERKAYHDPITEFVLQLNVDFDFDAVQKTIKDCRVLLENDMFLVPVAAEFLEKARQLLFETYCRIHHCIGMNKLAELLDLKEDNVEGAIVGLIRQSRLNAKIDSSQNQLIMQPKRTSIYQQVMDKTKKLVDKSQILLITVEKQAASKQQVY